MDPTSQADPAEYAVAFKSVRFAKNLCLLGIFLALVLQLVTFFLVRFGGVIDSSEIHRAQDRSQAQATHLYGSARSSTTAPADKAPAADNPTTRPAAEEKPVLADADDASAGREGIGTAVMWKQFFGWLLHATKVLTPVMAMLLSLTILLGVKLSLLGRLGGVAGLMSAFFWSLILLMLLSPWQEILRGPYACGAMYSLRELLTQTRQVKALWGASGVSGPDHAFYCIRFGGLPVLALLVWIAVLAKFSSVKNHMVFPSSAPAPAARDLETPSLGAIDASESEPL